MPPWFVTRTPMPCEFSMVWRSAGPSGALPKASFLITGFSRASEGAPARIEDNERRIIRRRAVFRVGIGAPGNKRHILPPWLPVGLYDGLCRGGWGSLWILAETDGNETGGKMARNHA